MDKEKYYAEMREKYDVHPDVLNYEDIAQMVPKLKGHEKLVNWLLHWLQVDEVNAVHSRWCDTPGPDFVKRMVEEDFKYRSRTLTFPTTILLLSMSPTFPLLRLLMSRVTILRP